MTGAGRRRHLLPDTSGTLRTVVRVAYLGGVAVALGWLAWDQRHSVAPLLDGARFAPLALALALGFVQLGLGSGLWVLALRSLGDPAPFPVVLDATARSLLARYLPGSVWYAVGRGALLRRHGVSTRALAAVSVLEIGLSVVVGFLLGSALLLVSSGLPPGVGWLALVGLGAAAVTCSPPVVNRALDAVGRRWGGGGPRLGWAAFAGLVGWLALFWISSAAMFVAYVRAFPAVTAVLPGVLGVAGAFLVTRVLGMLAVFAPQGLGVFEVALAALLGAGAATQEVGAGVAELVVVVAGFRLLILVRDGLAVAVAEARRR
ncbi:MAG: flippase-like domain-containing protein [Actinobacteria bacterium]|nr:flippase-like domain-containing protein [Actinomycetota bacterium]